MLVSLRARPAIRRRSDETLADNSRSRTRERWTTAAPVAARRIRTRWSSSWHARAGSAVFASYNIHKCVGSDRRFDPRPGAGGDRRDRRRRDRAAGGRPPLRRPGRAARPAGARRGDRPGAGAGHQRAPRARLARQPGAGARGRGATACTRSRCPGLEPRGALVVDLDLAVGPVRVVAAHLGLLRHSRLLQVEALLAHAGEGTDRPVVLMGDLNEWRRRAALGADAASRPASGRSAGVPSFPAYFPVLALDRVLAQPHEHPRAARGARQRRSRGSPPTTCRCKAVIRLDGTVAEAAAAAPFPARPTRRLLARLLADERPAP